MSSMTKFTPPTGWARAVLIHDGYGMPGTVEVQAWYPKAGKPDESVAYFDHAPDFVALLREDGLVKDKPSRDLVPSSAPTSERAHERERDLVFCAGVVIGAARLQAKINNVLESHAP